MMDIRVIILFQMRYLLFIFLILTYPQKCQRNYKKSSYYEAGLDDRIITTVSF